MKSLAASMCLLLGRSRTCLTFPRFERELEALRKELADATVRSGRSSPTSLGGDEDMATLAGSPILMSKDLQQNFTLHDIADDRKTQ